MIGNIWFSALLYIAGTFSAAFFTKNYASAFATLISVSFFSAALTITFWGR
jgi:uncharacterized membrane protein